MTPVEVFDTAYEAHYRLIRVSEADLYRWTAWCTGEKCRWHTTKYSEQQARDASLPHCREKHVRLTGW